MNKIKLGFCMSGSFCTFDQNIKLMSELAEIYDILPILSFNAYSIDTRFGLAKDYVAAIEAICGKSIVKSIEQAEPIGPTHMTDIMLVSPCTGNTLAKLASSITDTPVTMAVKSHLRNNNPVVLAISTNDALSGSAKNIGILQNTRNYYFVPMGQDNHKMKPTSLVANFSMAPETLMLALEGKQIQPMLLAPYKT